MAILVTGGAGYIGSHTCVELLNEGYEVVVLDNLSNSSEKSLERVEELTGKSVTFYKGDILDRDILNKIFAENAISVLTGLFSFCIIWVSQIMRIEKEEAQPNEHQKTQGKDGRRGCKRGDALKEAENERRCTIQTIPY